MGLSCLYQFPVMTALHPCFYYFSIFISLYLVSKLEASDEWEHLENCQLVPSFGNDGDSFLVRHSGDKEDVFRLYFVDCPEVSGFFPERVKEQSQYFNNLPKARTLELGAHASQFTEDFLKGSFSVYTQWKNARGQSKRFAAIIVNQEGTTLSMALAENGLVRIHGLAIKGRWKGRDADSFWANLGNAEKRAKANELGGWGKSDGKITTREQNNQRSRLTLKPRRTYTDDSLEGLVNINLASESELDGLPGVGPAIASRIIAGRPYKDVESMRKVKGIGDQSMITLKPYITVINANAPSATADYFRRAPERYLNRWVEVYIEMVVDVNWPAPDGFVVLQANTSRNKEFGGAIPIFFPEEKLEDILRFYGDKPADKITKTKAIFAQHNDELVLVIPRKGVSQ